jgi:hypothetical protein
MTPQTANPAPSATTSVCSTSIAESKNSIKHFLLKFWLFGLYFQSHAASAGRNKTAVLRENAKRRYVLTVKTVIKERKTAGAGIFPLCTDSFYAV